MGKKSKQTKEKNMVLFFYMELSIEV